MTEPMRRQTEAEIMDDPEIALAYARTDFAAVNAAFVERLLDLTGSAIQLDLLDLGCGPGDIPIRIAIARPGWRINALDASAPMLELARAAEAAAGFTGRVRWVLGNAAQPPVEDHSCDVLCSNSILHHLHDPAPLWRAAKRLLRAGGLVFMRDLYRPPTAEAAWMLVQQHATEASQTLKQEFYNSLLAAHTPQEIQGQLQAAGLAHLHVKTITDRHVDVWGRV